MAGTEEFSGTLREDFHNGAQSPSTQGEQVPLYRPFANGDSIPGEESLDVENPATREVVARVECAGPDQVNAAVGAARAAFEDGAWSRASARGRAPVLRQLADLLEDRVDKLARVDALCTGRPIRELASQVGRLPEWFRYFAGISEGLEGSVPPFSGQYLNYTERVPLGVAAQVVTWNHPLLLLVKKLAPALAAGNSVIIKPSELTPVSAILLAQTCTEAGIPPGVVNTVPGVGPGAGSILVGHPGIDKVDFTGGTETGRAIARAAGENIVSTTLELGGKTPVIVFPDADLEAALSGAMFASFVATGQTCVSGARLIVHHDLYERFVQEFASRAERLRFGHPLDPETQLGPVISSTQLKRVLSYVDLARDEGAHVVIGGGQPSLPEPLARGYFVEPTVLTDVRPDMRVVREEIFGPVVCMLPFGTEQEAIAIANDADFGLGASIWTSSIARAHRVARAVRAGIIWINDHHRNDPSSPWGGFGLSGYGRENGWESLRAYTAVKSVIVNLSDERFDWFGTSSGASRYG